MSSFAAALSSPSLPRPVALDTDLDVADDNVPRFKLECDKLQQKEQLT